MTGTERPAPIIEPSALVDTGAAVGAGSRVWHHAHIRDGATVGADCVIGWSVYIGPGSVVGDRVKIQNGSQVFGAHLEDETMLAPYVVLVEDPGPRATTPDGRTKQWTDWQRNPVTIRRGATVGAASVIAPGVTVGRYALVAVGSVVHRDVADHALVAGNPARQTGWVCACAHRLDDALTCPACHNRYQDDPDGLHSVEPAAAAS